MLYLVKHTDIYTCYALAMKTDLNHTIPLEHCDYLPETYSNFTLTWIEPEETITLGNREYNHLIVVLEGNLLIEYGKYRGNQFRSRQIVFIPAYADSHIEGIEKTRILLGTFELPLNIFPSKMMEEMWQLRTHSLYTFSAVRVKPQMERFLDLLIMYIEDQQQCVRLHEIKEKEIFFIFKWYYTPEEFVKLFYPIIGQTADFRSMILKHHRKTENVNELVARVGMSRTKFDTKFREVFGMSAKQWLLKRKTENMKHFISRPNVTVKDVLIQYNFESFSDLNRFFKQHFGKSPTEMIKESRK